MANPPAPAFPSELIAYTAFACAVAGGAALLTHFNGGDFQHWWSARNWTPTHCTLLRIDPDIRYSYQVNGKPFESGALQIGEQFDRPLEAIGSASPGAQLECWYNPAQPDQALLHREYSGWWWLPGAWLLSAFLLLTTLPFLPAALWRWITYRPDPPLTWAQWFATFYQGNAWAFTVIGLVCLLPGLLLLKFLTIDPWWNWRQAQSWPPAPATITKAEPRSWSSGSGRQATGGYVVDIAFDYEYAGRRYAATTYSPWRAGRTEWLLQSTREEGIAEILQRLAPGSRHTAFVSPSQPYRAYLYRDRTGGATYITAFGPFLTLLGLTILAARRP
jgi:hypothetical protein